MLRQLAESNSEVLRKYLELAFQRHGADSAVPSYSMLHFMIDQLGFRHSRSFFLVLGKSELQFGSLGWISFFGRMKAEHSGYTALCIQAPLWPLTRPL